MPTDYENFLKSLFYFDREKDKGEEPTASLPGNLHHRDTGKIVVLQYTRSTNSDDGTLDIGDHHDLYINKYSVSTSNDSKPSPMMIGRSHIKSTGNIDQDVFSIGFPKRSMNISGIATKNSRGWANIINDAIIYTLNRSDNVIEPGVSILLTSAGITLDENVNWNLSWDIYQYNEELPINLKNNLNPTLLDINLNPENQTNVLYPSTPKNISSNVLPKDRSLKWYDIYVKINTASLKNKVNFIPTTSILYFYTSSIDIQWKVEYEPIFALNQGTTSDASKSPLLNVKRLTNTIKLTGYCPTSKITENFITKDIADLFFLPNAEIAPTIPTDGEISIWATTGSGSLRLDKDLVSWGTNLNLVPFNLVNKIELQLSPDEPLKVSIDITRIYS